MGILNYFKRSEEQQPTATSNKVGYFMKSDIESDQQQQLDFGIGRT
ncbi:MAG: hypothetical protein ACTIDI_01170 [Pseudolactococcus laudensis]